MGGNMSILFVLLTFIIVITANYIWFRTPRAELAAPAPQPSLRPLTPVMTRQYGFSIPQGYCFHPGHTWVVEEGHEDARVGLDSFAADVVGKIDKIEVIGLQRWVRQGQRLMTLHVDGVSLDLLSPVEGVVTAVNKDVVRDPMVAARDPYKGGWIAVLKTPDFPTSQKNLLQTFMVAPWMHYNVTRLNAAVAKLNPALAQDGGVPLSGVLLRVEPDLRRKLIADFFLS
jgi:glycine cleavage system H lipoate-binding protein